MATWPEDLPQRFLKNSYKDQEPDLVLKTEMDVGPPKMRLRPGAKANVRPFSGDMRLTLTQKAALSDFYLDNCAVSFDFPDPGAESGTIPVIFTAPPEYADTGLFTGGEAVQKVSLKLAKVPA
jgi:hypothetical protein